MDRAAHGHSRTPRVRPEPRGHLHAEPRRAQERAGRLRHEGLRSGPDHRGHLHAGNELPQRGVPRGGRSGRGWRRCLRRGGRMQRLRVLDECRRLAHPLRSLQAHRRVRRRRHEQRDRLSGALGQHPVRRCCRCRRAGGRREPRPRLRVPATGQRWSRLERPVPAAPRAGSARSRSRQPDPPGLPAHEWPRGVQVRGEPIPSGDRGGAGSHQADAR